MAAVGLAGIAALLLQPLPRETAARSPATAQGFGARLRLALSPAVRLLVATALGAAPGVPPAAGT